MTEVQQLDGYTPDFDEVYAQAMDWVQSNPESKDVRLGLWKDLIRLCDGAVSASEVHNLLHAHLYETSLKKDHRRWGKGRVSASLMQEIKRQAEANPVHPDFVEDRLRILSRPSRVLLAEGWRAERIRVFLRAVTRYLQAAEVAGRRNEETTQ